MYSKLQQRFADMFVIDLFLPAIFLEMPAIVAKSHLILKDGLGQLGSGE